MSGEAKLVAKLIYLTKPKGIFQLQKYHKSALFINPYCQAVDKQGTQNDFYHCKITVKKI